MRKSSFATIIVCLVSLLGRAQSAEYIDTLPATGGGIKYELFPSGSDLSIGLSDQVWLHLIRENLEGEIIFSTYELGGEPVEFKVAKPEFNGDILEVLPLMSKGDSGVFYVCADSIYRHEYVPPNVQPGSWVRFRIKVTDVKSEEAYKSELNAKFTGQLQKDSLIILQFLSNQELEMTRIPGPVFYSHIEEGKGTEVSNGDTVTVHYELKLLNGKTLDSSLERDQPFKFVVGNDKVIRGWEMIFPHLRVGDRSMVILPSAFGYGERGIDGQIPPNAILKFYIEVLSVD